jgi:hypothetical protein
MLCLNNYLYKFNCDKMTERAYPTETTAESQDFKMTVKCYGTFEEFKFGVAQKGDPKGCVTLSGPNVKVSIGSRRSPQNLNNPTYLVSKLEKKIADKSMKLDFGLLNQLGEKTLGPYAGISNSFEN